MKGSPRRAQALRLLAVIGLAGIGGLELALLLHGIRRPFFLSFIGADFRALYAAAAIAQHEGFHRIYDLNAHEAVQRALLGLGPGDPNFVLIPMVFPAAFVLPVMGLLPLGPVGAWAVWTLLGTLALGVYLSRWWGSGKGRGMAIALALLSYPVFTNILWGQVGAWLVLCAGECLRHLHWGRPGWAGIWAAGLLIKPQTLLLVLPALLWEGGWRAVGSWAAAGAGVIGLSALLAGGEGLGRWLGILMGFAAGYPAMVPEVVGAETMMNWRAWGALGERWAPPAWRPGIWAGVGLGMGLTALAALRPWWGGPRGPAGDPLRWLGLWAATPVVGWHAHPHTAVLALPALLAAQRTGCMPRWLFPFWALAPLAAWIGATLGTSLGILPDLSGLGNLAAARTLFLIHLGLALAIGTRSRKTPSSSGGPLCAG